MTIKLHIDPDFRRQQFLAGVELPLSYETDCDQSRLRPEQRARLHQRFGEPTGALTLVVPVYSERADYVDMAPWMATINPVGMDAVSIIELWEAAYEAAASVAYGEYDKRG